MPFSLALSAKTYIPIHTIPNECKNGRVYNMLVSAKLKMNNISYKVVNLTIIGN